MSETRTSCGCGCGAMTTVTEVAQACECGCDCCREPVNVDEEVERLHRLRDGIDERLQELAG